MASNDKLITTKKPSYRISPFLGDYLTHYNRTAPFPIFYQDLMRFSGSVAVMDKNDNDSLWVRVFYNDSERDEIEGNLKRIYTLLLSDGSTDVLRFLNVDAIDYCTFGNSKPFRIKIRNILNDNFTYFYVKKADASRAYGLEFEHMLSPYNLNFLVCEDTLVEEHIAGIPGDEFIKDYLPKCSQSEKSQIAKQFVKFNERCMIRLLGDMRSYNYVIVPTHDFDQVVYKIRAIDFDQQSYEAKLKVYRPQFFKENFPMVELVRTHLDKHAINQYKIEERAIIAKRILSSESRLTQLMKCMLKDELSTAENVQQLKSEIYEYIPDKNFKNSFNMGGIVRAAFEFVKRNYENHEMLRES
jgi:hypothetical protein